MNDRSTLLLEHHLKELKLPSFLREYGKMAAQCAAEGVDHPGYLLRLAKLELIDRHQRMVERRIRAARFPAVKSMDTFDFTAIPSVNKALVMELARCESVQRRENVIGALTRIHRWTARGQRKGGEGVTGAMIRARIRVDGRLAGGLQALLGAPMAACSGCGERDGGIGHGKRRSRTGIARVGGDVQLAGWRVSGRRAPSGWEWNGSQSGQGASDLLLPRPALGKMQGQPACGAGEPSDQGEDPPPEGLGGHDLLTQADAGRPAGQVVGHHLYRQPGAVGREAPRGHVVQPDAVLEVAYRILDLGVAAMISLQFEGLPLPVGDEAVIAVSGEEGELGTGCRLHPPDNEPHRRGVGFGLEGSVGGLGHIGGAVHPVGNRRPAPVAGPRRQPAHRAGCPKET